MDEVLDKLEGVGFGSLPDGFREYAYAGVWRVLRRRRWAKRGRATLFVAASLCVVWLGAITVPDFVRGQYLARLPLDKLIVMHKEVMGRKISACYALPPLRQVVERSDVLVWGKVVEVTPNREDIKRAIVQAKSGRSKFRQMVNETLGWEVFGPERDDNIRVSLDLEVYKSYPALGAGAAKTIRRSDIDNLYYIKKGHEGIFAVRRLGRGRNGPYMVSVDHGGIYLIGGPRRIVSGIPSAAQSRPVEKAWEFICDLYDSIHGDEQTKAAALSKALRLLASSNQLDECYAALVLLESSPEAAVKAVDVMEAIERFYGPVRAGIARQGVDETFRTETYLGFVALGLKSIRKVQDEDIAERLCALYVSDMGSERPVFKDEVYSILEQVVGLGLRFPGAERRGRLERVFKARTDPEYEAIGTWEELQKKNLIGPVHSAVRALARVYDDDIEGLLLEMCDHPRRFGIYDSRTLGVVWEALADRGNPKVRGLLKEFVSAPERMELGVVYYPSLQAAVDWARAILGE